MSHASAALQASLARRQAPKRLSQRSQKRAGNLCWQEPAAPCDSASPSCPTTRTGCSAVTLLANRLQTSGAAFRAFQTSRTAVPSAIVMRDQSHSPETTLRLCKAASRRLCKCHAAAEPAVRDLHIPNAARQVVVAYLHSSKASCTFPSPGCSPRCKGLCLRLGALMQAFPVSGNLCRPVQAWPNGQMAKWPNGQSRDTRKSIAFAPIGRQSQREVP